MGASTVPPFASQHSQPQGVPEPMCPDAQMFADIRKITLLAACNGKFDDDSA